MIARDTHRGGLGSSAGPSALRRLISTPPDEFAENHWAQSALLSPAEELPGDFSDLLDEAAIDELVSRRGLRTPFLRVAKNGSTLSNRAFTAPGGVGATIDDQVSDDKLVRLFADGSTMVLQALHRVWPPILQFCADLAAELGHPVQANAYVTPPQNQGFSNHYDVHDVFVLQIAGEKEWTIHAPVHEAPLRDQPWTDRRAAVERRAAEPPLITTVLRPGDCLYLPRGFLHAARARGGVSSHLTLGVHSWTRYTLAERLLHHALAEAAHDASVRTSLELGVAFEETARWSEDLEVVRQRLAKALDQITPEDLQPDLLEASRAGQRAAPVGPLAQLRAASALEPTSTLRLRDHLLPTLDRAGSSRPVLRSRAGDFDLGEDELSGVRSLLEDGCATAGTLGLELSRRMILAGLAVAE